MNKNLKSLILTAAVCLALVACDSPTKRMEQAQALYNEGVQLREQRRSEEAAERFLQGLALVQRSDKTTETVQLEGQLRDNLTDLIFDGFSQRLLQLYPKLGQWDVRICCLSKNGFSNSVISILLDTQTDSYYKRKTRIKQKKMDLGRTSLLS